MRKYVLLSAMFFCCLQLIHSQSVRVDSSFGINGIVSSDLGKRYVYPSPSAYQILSQADGSLYVLEGNSLIKRASNGYVDSGFRIDGTFYIKKILVQPDGVVFLPFIPVLKPCSIF